MKENLRTNLFIVLMIGVVYGLLLFGAYYDTEGVNSLRGDLAFIYVFGPLIMFSSVIGINAAFGRTKTLFNTLTSVGMIVVNTLYFYYLPRFLGSVPFENYTGMIKVYTIYIVMFSISFFIGKLLINKYDSQTKIQDYTLYFGEEQL